MTILVPGNILAEAGQFLEECGSVGHEGTGMLGGVDRSGTITVTRFLAPDQTAGTFPSCWVEVTRRGQYELAVALASDERWVARIHSHPGEAFHSATDHANPGLTAEGAISIVVPYFGLGLRHGIGACALYQRRKTRWIETSASGLGIALA
jgi:hypothetical protein